MWTVIDTPIRTLLEGPPTFRRHLISERWIPIGPSTLKRTEGFYSRSGIESSELSLLGSPGVSVFSDFAS